MTQNDYTYFMAHDKDRNILGLVVRYKYKESIFIPLIDIILQMEKCYDRKERNIKGITL